MTRFKSIIYKKVPSKDKYVLLFITCLVVLLDLSISTLTRSLTVLATAFYFLTFIVSIITDLNRYFVPTPITSVLLFSISLTIGLEAVRRIHKPENIVYNVLILIVAILGLILNCLFFIVQTNFYVRLRSKSAALKKTSSTDSRRSSHLCPYAQKSPIKPSKNQSIRKFRQSSFDTLESQHSHHHHHHTFPHKRFLSCKNEECISEHKNLPISLFKSESYESIEFDNIKSSPFSKNENTVKVLSSISENKDDKGQEKEQTPVTSTVTIEEENFFKSKYEERGSDEMESCFEIRMADEPPKVYRDQCFQINMDLDEQPSGTDDKGQESLDSKSKVDKKDLKKSKNKFKSKIPRRKQNLMNFINQNKLQRYKKDINKLANWKKCEKNICKKKQMKKPSFKDETYIYPGFQKPKYLPGFISIIMLYSLPTLMCFVCYFRPTDDALLCLISLLPLIHNSLSSLKWSFEYLRYEISKREYS